MALRAQGSAAVRGNINPEAVSRDFDGSTRLFFFNDRATTEIYTLSLHGALPIWLPTRATSQARSAPRRWRPPWRGTSRCLRSAQHTSELQSPMDLVCLLLLE